MKDPIANLQTFEERRPVIFEGERRLLAAVLGDAFDSYRRTFQARRNRERTLHREVSSWIFSNDRAAPLSFRNICDTLDLDAARLRRKLLEWRAAADRIGRLRTSDGGSRVPGTWRARSTIRPAPR